MTNFNDYRQLCCNVLTVQKKLTIIKCFHTITLKLFSFVKSKDLMDHQKENGVTLFLCNDLLFSFSFRIMSHAFNTQSKERRHNEHTAFRSAPKVICNSKKKS